jgi:hypothetical protein
MLWQFILSLFLSIFTTVFAVPLFINSLLLVILGAVSASVMHPALVLCHSCSPEKPGINQEGINKK